MVRLHQVALIATLAWGVTAAPPLAQATPVPGGIAPLAGSRVLHVQHRGYHGGGGYRGAYGGGYRGGAYRAGNWGGGYRGAYGGAYHGRYYGGSYYRGGYYRGYPYGGYRYPYARRGWGYPYRAGWGWGYPGWSDWYWGTSPYWGAGYGLGAVTIGAPYAYGGYGYGRSCWRESKPVLINGRWRYRMVTVCQVY